MKRHCYTFISRTLEVLPQGENNKYCYNIVVRDLTLFVFNVLFPFSLFYSDSVVSDMALKLSILNHVFTVSYKTWGWSCL